MSKVTVLEKPMDQSWSAAEVSALTSRFSLVEQLRRLPNRLVVIIKPRNGTIEDALGHANYTSKEVDNADRWL